jgi:hypothetical protein
MIEVGETPEAELVGFVRGWFALLARGQWEHALAAIDEPHPSGVRWTQDGLNELLQNVYGPGTRFEVEHGAPRFSDPDLSTGTAHHSFGRLNAGGFWVDHDVPLNGVFSDLTAQFEFLPRAGRFAVLLHDMHVL